MIHTFGTRFDVLGTEGQEHAFLLQHIEDGPQEHTRALHGNMHQSMDIQPVDQCQQISRHGPEGAGESLDCTILLAHQHTDHNRLFVHVLAEVAQIEYLHTVCSLDELVPS